MYKLDFQVKNKNKIIKNVQQSLPKAMEKVVTFKSVLSHEANPLLWLCIHCSPPSISKRKQLSIFSFSRTDQGILNSTFNSVHGREQKKGCLGSPSLRYSHGLIASFFQLPSPSARNGSRLAVACKIRFQMRKQKTERTSDPNLVF